MSGSATPIVSIPVDDAAFKRFHDLFQKYEASVKSLPAAWAAVEGHLKTMGGYLERIANASERQGTSVRRMGEDAGAFRRTIDAVARQFEKVDHSVYNISRHIASATLDLFKWSTIFTGISGLLGAGGLFGLNRLAQASAGGLRTARGLGVTTAEAQAFSINYQRAVDPGSVLGNVADAQSDYTKRWAFNALGVNGLDRDPALVAQDVVERARRMYLQSDRSQQFAQAHGLLEFMTMEDLRRLGAMSDKEVAGMRTGMAGDVNRLHMDPSTGVGWQNFINQMERAGTVLENSFIKVLIGLEKPLETFSERLVKVVEAMEPKMAEWIDALGRGLQVFADYLGSAKFRQDVIDFTSAIESLGGVIMKVVHLFSPQHTPDGRAIAPSGVPFFQYVPPNAGRAGGGSIDRPAQSSQASYLRSLEQANNLPPGVLDRIWDMESNRGANAGYSWAGALGPFQFMSATAQRYGITDRRDFYQEGRGAASYLSDLHDMFGDWREAVAAYNAGEGRVSEAVRQYGNDWLSHLPRETQNYVNRTFGASGQVVININNNTGGSAVVSTSQLASTPQFVQ